MELTRGVEGSAERLRDIRGDDEKMAKFRRTTGPKNTIVPYTGPSYSEEQLNACLHGVEDAIEQRLRDKEGICHRPDLLAMKNRPVGAGEHKRPLRPAG